jgi:hypothetical protein
MRAWQRTVLALVCAGVWGFGTPTSASAQVCGDADGNGSVNVTDGVQVLRAAAGLTSTCTQNANDCNIDGAGDVTVTDGVNVLRKAAGLSVTENCPGGGTDDDVEEITDRVVPFLKLGLDSIPNVSFGAVPAEVEDCEDGGTRDTEQDGDNVTVTFSACKVSEPGLGAFQLDGFIDLDLGFPSGSVTFELKVTDFSNGRVVDFDGTLTGTVRPTGGFVLDGGPIAVRDSEGGPVVFTLTFDDLAVDGDGNVDSGSVQAEDTSDSFDLKTAEIEVEDGNDTAAELRVVRDDDSEDVFLINLETGDITPAN